MAYAALNELIARHGETELVQITDVTRSGSIDLAIVNRAIADADAEIDSYLAARYTLPLVTIPTALGRIACDVVRYRLYDKKAPEEVRKRYEDAVKWLSAVASGSRDLGLPPAQKPAQTGGAVLFSGGGRVFSRGTLEDL